MDLVPTVYSLAGIPVPPFVEGVPLQPLVNGDRNSLHEAIFAESNYHAAYEPMRCVRTRRHKLIRRYDDRDRPNLPNVDDTNSKKFLLTQGWRDQTRDQELLYDLVFDPYETNNLIDLPIMKDVAEDLRLRLESWMHETDDPLLKGDHVPVPAEAVTNDPDGESPNEPVIPIGRETTFI